MLIFPEPDPIAFAIGPLTVRWYGIFYLIAIFFAIVLGRRRIKQSHIVGFGFTKQKIEDVIFYCFIAGLLGGRLGEVLFYNPAYYFSHPSKIIAVWEGGMAFHGGIVGGIIGLYIWARKNGYSFPVIADICVPLVPLGNSAGRIANFINGELYGRVTDPSLPWAMIYPHVDNLPRHPSEIYQSLGQFVLFITLWFYAKKVRPTGAVMAFYLIGYAVVRSFTEMFRNPDYTVNFLNTTITSGQLLSIPMFLVGIIAMWAAYKGNILPCVYPQTKGKAAVAKKAKQKTRRR